jgi:predicted DNA-binding WGR domain protein
MKKQFEYIRGRTRVFWEVERHGVVLTSRSWGPRRKEYITTRRFRSEASAERARAKLIQSQLDRDFVESGTGARARARERLEISGPPAVAKARRAIIGTVVPKLRALGFQGTFPKFRRIGAHRHSVLWFDFGRAGGHISTGFGVVTRKAGTTVAQDYLRALHIRNKKRTFMSDLVPWNQWLLCFFDRAAKKWGKDWPEQMASLIARLIESRAMAWFATAGAPAAGRAKR